VVARRALDQEHRQGARDRRQRRERAIDLEVTVGRQRNAGSHEALRGEQGRKIICLIVWGSHDDRREIIFTFRKFRKIAIANSDRLISQIFR
jgi:hypothetical protein